VLRATRRWQDAADTYQRVLSQLHEPVEIAHASLGLAASKRLLGTATLEDYSRAWGPYHQRGMRYCMAHVLIDRALWAAGGEGGRADLSAAEALCRENGYTAEAALVEQIAGAGAVLHPLNFP
jgi:hypothetical protein